MLTETTLAQLIVSSYPQPNSMLYPQGTVHNTGLLIHYLLSLQIYSTFLGNILDILTQVSDHLHTIILMSAQYYSARLQWTVEYLEY